jgi:sulfur carrier protein
LDTEIFLNGEKKSIPHGFTVADLVNFLDLVPQRLAIEYNLQILKREDWDKKVISSGDRIEIVHFVGGGTIPRPPTTSQPKPAAKIGATSSTSSKSNLRQSQT